jgi:hypothetical protein
MPLPEGPCSLGRGPDSAACGAIGRSRPDVPILPEYQRLIRQVIRNRSRVVDHAYQLLGIPVRGDDACKLQSYLVSRSLSAGCTALTVMLTS